jgi:dienelactone hydrolase
MASAGGPNRFSIPLQGRVAPTRIGVIGHSRGGKNLLRWAAANQAAVGAIVLVAPLFDRSVPVPDVPTAMLLGTCDDDTGRTGAGYLATARRSPGRTQPFWSLTMRGANHNFYNRTLVRLRNDDAAGARGRCARSRRPKATGQQAFLVRIAWDHLTRSLLAAPAAPWQRPGATSGSLYGQRVALRTHRVG